MPKRRPEPDEDELEDEEPPEPCYTPEEVVEQERAKRSAEVADQWWYRNRDGEGVLLRFRLEANDCNVTLQTVMHGYDQWATGWPADKKVPLYRAYEIGELPIFIVEGEDAVDAAIALGLSAVTSAGGPEDVDKSDWQPVAGRRVVISPTNSDEGRRFARAVAQRVLALDPPPEVRMLALPGLDEGDDIGSFQWKVKLSDQERAERIRQLAARMPVMKMADTRGGPAMEPVGDIVTRPVRWLWPGRVPIGKPTVIFGGCDAGKSLIGLDLAARVSAGADWPDGRGKAPLGKVILMSREDHLADTIRPRLELAGAVLERIIALNKVTRVIEGREVRRNITLGDLADLERAIEIAGNVRLVVIDPLSAYFGRDRPSAQRTRQAIDGLTALAYRHGLAVIITAELGGRDGLGYGATMALNSVVRTVWMLTPVPGPLDVASPSVVGEAAASAIGCGHFALEAGAIRNRLPVESVAGSGHHGQASTLAHGTHQQKMATPSFIEGPVPSRVEGSRTEVAGPGPVDAPESGSRMLLLPVKTSVRNPGGGLALWVGENSVEWEPAPVPSCGAMEMLEPGKALPAAGELGSHLIGAHRLGRRPLFRMTAAQWLQEQLSGDPVPVGTPESGAGTLQAAARSAGISWTTVRRAFEEMGGVTEKCPRTGKSMWRLPAQAPVAGDPGAAPVADKEG